MEPVTVIAPGSEVRISDGILGRVQQVCIEDGLTVSYQVIWWDGRVRRAEWLRAFEVTPISNNAALAIGFHS